MEIGRIKKETSESIVEIDGKKIFTGLTFAGLVAFFSFWLITLPTNKDKLQSTEHQRVFDVLNFTLRSENETIRNNSILLLLELGFFEGKSERIKQLINSNRIPDWSNYEDYKSTIEKLEAPAFNSIGSNQSSNTDDKKTSGKNPE